MPGHPVSLSARALLVGLVAAAGCDATPHELRAQCPPAPRAYEPNKPQTERDEIVMRLAWGLSAEALERAPTLSVQTPELGAAVVVAGDGSQLCWARGAEHPLDHPAPRALRLAAARAGDAWILFTTHEPCPHCTGAALSAPVQGMRFDLQGGPESKTWERVYQDTHRVGGQCPHPVAVQKAQVPVLANRVGAEAIAALVREPVRTLRGELQGWALRYQQNEPLLRASKALLEGAEREGCVATAAPPTEATRAPLPPTAR